MPKDYIDREEIYKAVGNLTESYRVGESGVYYSAWRIDEMIGNLPAADVAPVVHGEWIITKKRAPNGRKILYEIKTCSVCGKTHGRHKPNYCPNCGAKMNGERRGNTEKRF